MKSFTSVWNIKSENKVLNKYIYIFVNYETCMLILNTNFVWYIQYYTK